MSIRFSWVKSRRDDRYVALGETLGSRDDRQIAQGANPGIFWTCAFLLSCTVWVMMSCTTGSKTESRSDSTSSANDTIAYTIATVELKSKNCPNEDSACAVARYSFPQLDASASKPLQDSLAHIWTQLFGPCSKTIGPEACAVEFVKGYEETVHEAHQDGMDYTIPWYSNVSAIVFQSHGMFGIQAVSDEFGGGEHTNTIISTYQLDPATGRRLHYSDIYADTAALARRMYEAFYQKNGLTPGKPISQDGRFFGNARLALPSVWIPEVDSLYLYWNTYELGPRSSGDYEVKIYVKDLYKQKPTV